MSLGEWIGACMKITAKLENDKVYGKVDITVHVHGLPKGTGASKDEAENALRHEVSSFAANYEKVYRSFKSGERKTEYTESFGSIFNNITLEARCDATLRGVNGFTQHHHLVGIIMETAKAAVMDYIEKCISRVKAKS